MVDATESFRWRSLTHFYSNLTKTAFLDNTESHIALVLAATGVELRSSAFLPSFVETSWVGPVRGEGRNEGSVLPPAACSLQPVASSAS